MTVQLPLPGYWPRNMSRSDPIAALEQIERDKADVAQAIELVLDRYADKHGMDHKVAAKAVSGYIPDMLSDVFFELEGELERERDEAPEIG